MFVKLTYKYFLKTIKLTYTSDHTLSLLPVSFLPSSTSFPVSCYPSVKILHLGPVSTGTFYQSRESLSWLFEFPWAAIKRYCKLGGLK